MRTHMQTHRSRICPGDASTEYRVQRDANHSSLLSLTQRGTQALRLTGSFHLSLTVHGTSEEIG